MVSKENIESIIINQGLNDYKWIDPSEIIVAQWVRVKCMFGCSDYGLGTCPPNTPSVSECERFFREYSSGVIIRLNKYADKNDYPSDWSKEMTDKLLEVEKKIFLLGFPKVFLLNQTCCTICKRCPGTRIECKDKQRSRPSPESFAVDVYQTVKSVGMEIHVVADNPAEMNRIAILLVE
jgi:predicted metal-binding protein